MMSTLLVLMQKQDLISPGQKQQAEEYCISHSVSVPDALIALGIFNDGQQLTGCISQLLNLRPVELNYGKCTELYRQEGLEVLMARYHAMPVKSSRHTLTLAVADPTHQQIVHDFRFASGKQIELVLANQEQIRDAFRHLGIDDIRVSPEAEFEENELEHLLSMSEEDAEMDADIRQSDSPVARFINQVLIDAIRKQASDIHFEPFKDHLRIRMRCDGMLRETHCLPAALISRVCARIKIIALLDIAERRLPQDGRFSHTLPYHSPIDLRVSTLPTLWGEKIVLRLLHRNDALLEPDSLGMNSVQLQQFKHSLNQTRGIILITGPTGSGKTQSLYSGLNYLNHQEVNISTAEDPIEITIPGLNQVQIEPKIGMGFAEALRAFLRQDPDIVMVGEIRDNETAHISVRAAQTGHLVLSTLHTGSSAEAVLRLHQMGIDPFLLLSSINMIIAQRLIRKLCPHCKQPERPDSLLREQWQPLGNAALYQASSHGCRHCHQGYAGRTGLYEIMPFTKEFIRTLLKRHALEDIEKVAVQNGMQTLLESGLEKALQGTTSLDELQRVLDWPGGDG